MTDTTHAPGCWSWGPRHYECAMREIERMEKALKDIRSLSSSNSTVSSNPFAIITVLAEIHHITNAMLKARETSND